MLGQVTNGKNLTIPDMSFREVALFVPLIAWAIWIGVYPKPYFEVLQRPVAEIVERVRPGYFGGVMAERQQPPVPIVRAAGQASRPLQAPLIRGAR
jgi:NADH-quinone oxidoreductase subunit M